MTAAEISNLSPEQHGQIELIHVALDTYPIHVNSTINETKTLPEWIQGIAMDTRELKDLTKGERDARDVSKARHKLIDAFNESHFGKFALWCATSLKTPFFTIVSGLLIYAIVKAWFPQLLVLFNAL